MLRAPAFWDRPPEAPGLLARALTPLAAITATVTARRVARSEQGLRIGGVRVICLGNLTVGGAGKTPAAVALAGMLAARGRRVAIISRGHGGRLSGPVAVDPRRHGAADVGDEPLMLAGHAPVFVARDRAAALSLAAEAGAEVVLMDDGFQNPAVAKDLSILVVDAARGFGNGRCLPAGPLREPVAAGMARADLVLTVGGPEAQAAFGARWGGAIAGRPRLQAGLEPLQTGFDWRGSRVWAFAGIARPERFFESLRALGADLAGMVALPDHAPLGQPMIARLLREARAAGAQLVTTEKDAVRLPQALRPEVLVLPVRLRIGDPAPLQARLSALGL
jgi:tetraacyldisaccharide 4'-kinase